jgi:hypothetical protein
MMLLAQSWTFNAMMEDQHHLVRLVTHQKQQVTHQPRPIGASGSDSSSRLAPWGQAPHQSRPGRQMGAWSYYLVIIMMNMKLT